MKQHVLFFVLLLIAGTAIATMIVNEDFEGTGIPTNWNDAGSPNYDYTTSPLAGVQSLRLTSASTDLTQYNALSNSEIWFSFLMKVTTMPASQQTIIQLYSSDVTGIMDVTLLANGKLVVEDAVGGNISAQTVDALSVGTIYNVWGHYKKGTGANSVAEVSFDVVGNPRPNSGNKFAGGTNGVSTKDDQYFRFSFGSDGTGVFDTVQICDTDCFAAGATPTPTATATATTASSPSNRFFLFPQ